MSRPHLLFVCGRNLRRSPTAETLYRDDPRVAVRSGGVSPSARRRVNAADLAWADVIFVMERKHHQRLLPLSPTLPPVINLEIPDDYAYLDPDLQDLLRPAIEAWLEAHSAS